MAESPTTSEWKTYRTRFLVKAKQLNASLTFIDPLDRKHTGRKGDYLVESSDGIIRIAPRQIFEDIYVLLAEKDRQRSENGRQVGTTLPLSDEQVRGRRKLPQPCRDRRTSSRLGTL
jgi:hypothetical protein